MIDIINTFTEAGHSCVLVTGRLVERNIPLDPMVRVERIIKYNRDTTFKRLFTWGVGFIQIWFRIAIKYRKTGLFIVSNPPFAPLLPMVVKNPFQLLIFDIYPDALSELGYLSEKSLLIRCWKKSNRKVFARAKSIFTITDSMKQVIQKYAGNKQVEVVPLWTDNTFFKSIDPTQNHFLKEHKLSGKFIVMYSGNIGLSGDIDVLLDVAAEIKSDNITFLIIGDGAKKDMISEKAKNLDLKNFNLLPWQPVAELPYSFSSASLAVISLGIKTSKLSVPSKLYNFLSVGAPLLCIASKTSEVENLVTKYNCGKSFEPDDISGMVNFIIEVAENKELHSRMKANALIASGDFNKINSKKFLITTYFD